MKKRKFNLILNVAIMCLCICAIAIGVYSAKNANLNISGSVGFNAHNCDVDVMAYIYGDSATANTNTAEPAYYGVVRTKENKKALTTAPVEVRGNNDGTIDLKTFYFCDMTDNDTISPITIEFVLTNQSLFDVDASIKATTISYNGTDLKYIDTKASDEITLNKKGSTDENSTSGTLTLTLTLNQKTSITEMPTISITLNMYKAVPKTDLSTSWKDTGTNGLFNTSGYTFEDEGQSETIKLTKDNIQYLSFTRDEPDKTSYKKANGLNLADTSTTEYPINVYAKTSTDDSTLYDVVVYSESKIYPVNCSSMFNSWSKLSIAIFNNFYTNKVTYMSSMFMSCSSLTNLDISNFNTSNVTNMSYVFYACSSLTNLDVSHFNTSKVTNMSAMFAYCKSLTSLEVSNFNTSNVTSMGGMFNSCLKLTNLDVSHFDTSNVTSMYAMFNSCSSLTSLDLSNINTSKVTDMGGMFYSCSSLTTIFVSSYDSSTKTGWCIDNVTSSSRMFSGCEKLFGGAGTKYDSTKTDKTYARIDGGTSAPGYLTKNINSF